MQVCAVGGTAAPPPQTLVPQARWTKKQKTLTEQEEQLWTGSSEPGVALYTPTPSENPAPESCGAFKQSLHTKWLLLVVDGLAKACWRD